MNADIGILTAAKDALEIIPVKVLFEPTIVLFRSHQGEGGSCLAAATLGFGIVKAGSRVDDE